MNTKIKAIGVFIAMFTIFSIVYYEVVIETVSVKKPILYQLRDVGAELATCSDATVIRELTQKSDELFERI